MSGPGRAGVVALRLLLVVAPVVRRPAEDVLRACRRLGPELVQDLVGEVVELEVIGGDGAHRHGELELPPLARLERRVILPTFPGLLEQRQRILPVVMVLDAPAAVVQADHRDVESRRVEARGIRDLVGEIDGALAKRDDLDGE